MLNLTLSRQGNPLAESANQLRILACDCHTPFEQALVESDLPPLQARRIEVLQVNVGRLCNQTCRHCHVDAGPERREIMSRETMQTCLDVLARSYIPILDITGGAPEMNPHFRWFVAEARRRACWVIDRCNLTILQALVTRTCLNSSPNIKWRSSRLCHATCSETPTPSAVKESSRSRSRRSAA